MPDLVISGEVIHGDQRGRLLGFPTANVRIPAGAVTRLGVYAGRLDGAPAAVSVGVRPTFGAHLEPMLEAHVLDFSGDLYGRRVNVELLEFVREEAAFDGAAALVRQMERDVRQVRELLADHDREAAHRAEVAIDALRAGEMVVLDGSANGYCASHLVIAADHADAAAINTMATDARGLVALAMTATRCDQLGLPLQRGGSQESSGRPFGLSIEARHGVTTGISAEDRAVTVAAAIRPDASAEEIVVPGPVFPMRAADGGVLERAQDVEAAIDLARLGGGTPAAVICTLLDDAGDVADRQSAAAYADRRGLPIVAPADVVVYRRAAAAATPHGLGVR